MLSDITDLLDRIRRGDRNASEDLLPLVYDQLRRLAAKELQREAVGHTLQPTALVHEAYMRLVGDTQKNEDWESIGHFFSAAAIAMRRVLVDHARAKKRLKRGGTWKKTDLGKLALSDESQRLADPEYVLALDDALAKFGKMDPTSAELVHLRFFGGLTIRQTATTLGISERQANKLWAYAKAWLSCEIFG